MLADMARCIMLQATLPKSMWAVALNTAVYLRSRSATKSLDAMTPIETGQRKNRTLFI